MNLGEYVVTVYTQKKKKMVMTFISWLIEPNFDYDISLKILEPKFSFSSHIARMPRENERKTWLL